MRYAEKLVGCSPFVRLGWMAVAGGRFPQKPGYTFNAIYLNSGGFGVKSMPNGESSGGGRPV